MNINDDFKYKSFINNRKHLTCHGGNTIEQYEDLLRVFSRYLIRFSSVNLFVGFWRGVLWEEISNSFGSPLRQQLNEEICDSAQYRVCGLNLAVASFAQSAQYGPQQETGDLRVLRQILYYQRTFILLCQISYEPFLYFIHKNKPKL